MRSRIAIGGNVSKKPKPTQDDPEESARFLETAKTIGANNSAAFARAMKKIVPKKRTKRS